MTATVKDRVLPVRLHRYKHSRVSRLGPGRWVCGPNGTGAALRGGPSRVNGVFVNLPRGLFGVTWPRRDLTAPGKRPA